MCEGVWMKSNNNLSVYDDQKIMEIASKIQDFIDTIQEIDQILANEIENPTKTLDNVIYIDPSIFVEAEKLRDTELPLEEIINVYDRWFETLNYITKVNVGNYGNNPRVFEFVIRLRALCATFAEFFEPTKPNKPTHHK